MEHYQAPLEDMRYVITDWLEAPATWARIPALQEVDAALTDQVLKEAARFSSSVIAPLNATGDRQGCRFAEGKVRTPDGFPAAYQAFVDAGWPALAAHTEDGGQGLPQLLNTALLEMLYACNHAWAMYTGIAHGAYECLRLYAPQWLRERYLPAIVSGEILPTMCLSEPQAGSDVGLLRTRAEPAGDDGYIICGSKIFASGGEHDLTQNILHLVLARLPGSPAGSRGISLFVVPKHLPDGSQNNIHCDGIEHKMGIRGSATCALRFDNALGWMLGEPNQGLAAMFAMMNSARLYVGMQGLGHAEAAWQSALTYALDRRQMRAVSKPAGAPEQEADPIHFHPALRHTLLELRVHTQGMRMLGYWVAHMLDISQYSNEAVERESCTALTLLLTPLIKAHFTERGFFSASAALQIFGGYGYCQEYPIEQTLRDSRIAMIYEGTNEIQANDLLLRKVLRGKGSLGALMDLYRGEAALMADAAIWSEPARVFEQQTCRIEEAVEAIRQAESTDPEAPYRVAGAFLRWLAVLSEGYVWLRAVRVSCGNADSPIHAEKLESARYFFDYCMPKAAHQADQVRIGLKASLPFLSA
ncbi:acyl-CoA dehydrogenase family protein [Pseudomonas putida]|uniref:acyl-CoA dehydrogenase family protein n=1 Tax=Pseudomonas putida TaxID=303 RepID=UPI00062A2712|nr:acyl-CoA dehydrogenase family protein [Pseudomonas putida]